MLDVVATIVVGILLVVGLWVTAVVRMRETAKNMNARGRMCQLAVAMHNVDDTHGRLPPMLGHFPAEGPRRGWGTAFFHLLPYIEEDGLHAGQPLARLGAV